MTKRVQKEPYTEQPYKYRIAYIDIECAPCLGYVWSKWQTDVLSFTKDWYMTSLSVNWEGSEEIDTYALIDFPKTFAKDPENDVELLKILWTIFDQADLIIAHNGDAFDIKKTNTRFLFHGMPPPSPFKSVDTLRALRDVFALTSNSLDDACQFLGIGKKLKTDKQLWLDVIRNIPGAWEMLKQYNAQDIVLVKALYHRIKGWIKSHPNITLGLQESLLCPACGGPTERRGWQNLKSYRAQRYHCTSKDCGKWATGKRQKIEETILS